MTTADYDMEKFLRIGETLKAELSDGVKLVANVGDFDRHMAERLRRAGYTSTYHIVRMGEGTDTDLPVEKRVATLDAIRDAGMELIYCVEPIGPEHTPEQIAEEMLRARDYNVDVMAVMRRVPVKGSYFEGKGQLTEREMTKIAAVARLVTHPRLSMNVHEPMMMPLLAGVNQFYAEYGANPRDCQSDTAKGRGISVERAREMLAEGGCAARGEAQL